MGCEGHLDPLVRGAPLIKSRNNHSSLAPSPFLQGELVSRNRTAKASAIGILAVAGLLLTGCSGGQSQAEACTIVQDTLEKAQTELSESVSSFGDDPVAGSEAVNKLAKSFSDANGEISNGDVKPESTKATEALDAFAAEMETASADPSSADPTALSDAVANVQSTFADLQKVCQG